jgi:spore maturation protein CgeB
MKILLVGSDFEFGIEQYYKKHLAELGCEVIHYPAPDIVQQRHSKNLLNKVLFRSGLARGYKPVNEELIRLAEASGPDFIWVYKGMEIYTETLEQLRKKFRLANYNPDHPYIISGPGSGNGNVTRSVGLYHLHFCYNSSLQKQITEKFGIPTVFLPFGYELSEQEYAAALSGAETNRICFIGNPDKIRAAKLSLLAKTGLPVDVYGHGWDGALGKNGTDIRIFDAVYGMEYWKKLRQYRIQLNVFRRHNAGSHNMRSFEIPAVGGIQLGPYSDEQASFFLEGKEIFFYRNDDALLKQANDLLRASEDEANRYRAAARERSLASHYSYFDRARTVYEAFLSFNNPRPKW